MVREGLVDPWGTARGSPEDVDMRGKGCAPAGPVCQDITGFGCPAKHLNASKLLQLEWNPAKLCGQIVAPHSTAQHGLACGTE